MDKPKSDRVGAIIGGIILLALGVWFLLQALGLDLPGLGQLWPIFPTLGGLAFIATYILGEDEEAGLLVPGVAGLLIGIFFFFITLGPLGWEDLAVWWPIFPLLGGVAFTITWLADRGETGLLVPGLGGILVGLVGFLAATGGLEMALLARWWPLLIILVGILILVQNLRGRGS